MFRALSGYRAPNTWRLTEDCDGGLRRIPSPCYLSCSSGSKGFAVGPCWILAGSVPWAPHFVYGMQWVYKDFRLGIHVNAHGMDCRLECMLQLMLDDAVYLYVEPAKATKFFGHWRPFADGYARATLNKSRIRPC